MYAIHVIWNFSIKKKNKFPFLSYPASRIFAQNQIIKKTENGKKNRKKKLFNPILDWANSDKFFKD